MGREVRVWSSPLQRAADTAGVIAARLDALPVIIDERLVEADVGPWQGLTAEDIEAGWPGFLSTGSRPEGFEPGPALLGRVLPALVEIATQTAPGVQALVVAHAGVLRALRRHTGAADERVPNLGGSWFSVEPVTGEVQLVGELALGEGRDARR